MIRLALEECDLMSERAQTKGSGESAEAGADNESFAGG
jgi:hypothetical protein